MGASICWGATDSGTQLSVFDSSASKKQLLIFLKRAEYSIKSYELEAIGETEKAFVKTVNRKSGRCNLSYFFGILKNIQQQRDEEAIRQYCRKRYNYQRMLDMQRKQETKQQPVAIDDIISMLEKAVTKKS